MIGSIGNRFLVFDVLTELFYYPTNSEFRVELNNGNTQINELFIIMFQHLFNGAHKEGSVDYSFIIRKINIYLI